MDQINLKNLRVFLKKFGQINLLYSFQNRMDDLKNSKIELYEHFVNDRLKSDLEKCYKEQERIYAEMAEYLQVKETIEKLTQARLGLDPKDVEPLKVKVDLGCNFYAKAVIEDTSYIYVAIGYGFFLQMKFNEALKFIEKKMKSLNELADELTVKICEIKANIKFVLEGLREMQNIDPTSKQEVRDIF